MFKKEEENLQINLQIKSSLIQMPHQKKNSIPTIITARCAFSVSDFGVPQYQPPGVGVAAADDGAGSRRWTVPHPERLGDGAAVDVRPGERVDMQA